MARILWVEKKIDYEPQGIMSMTAVLRQAGHQVEMTVAALEDPVQVAREFQPDILGFSVMTGNQHYFSELNQQLRKALAPAQPLSVFGGPHATFFADIIHEPDIDGVCIGEGEGPILDLANSLEDGRFDPHIYNWWFKINGEVIENPIRPLVRELGTLPLPDRTIIYNKDATTRQSPIKSFIAGRGCPYRCTYCFNHAVVRMYRRDLQCTARELNYIRYFPLDSIIAEIEDVQSRFENISMFIFDDDLFTYNKDYLLKFCDAYRRVSDLPFVVNGHVGFFDRERAEALASANCRIVKFGLESGSERVREKILNRHTKNEQIADAIALAHEVGLHSSVFIMIGLPHEEETDLWDTVNILAATRPGRFRWTFFFPFPGTEAYNISADGGYIDFDAMKNMANFTDRSCLRFGPKQDLLLRKVGKIMPWFVNAAADWPAAAHYRERVDSILAMDKTEWEATAPTLLDDDTAISSAVQNDDLSHYAVKYNSFMGVISDYFLNE